MNYNRMKSDRTRGIGMTRLAMFTLLVVGIHSAQANEVLDNQKELQNRMDSIDSKRGVEVGGTVRAVFDRSIFVGEKDMNGVNTTPDREQNEFAQFDLKLGFRPWEDTRANVIIRMGAGMQEYFYAPAKTITVPWINIEGHWGDSFYWVVGDFRQQISPLTLYSPDIEIMYEPEVYRRARYMAKDQMLLSGNQRNLQGVNLQYRDGFGEILSEVRAEGLFSRLRRVEFVDASGAMGNILPNDAVPGASQAGSMDKYLASANLEAFPLKKNVMAGFTQMYIWDAEKSLVQEWNGDSVSPINPFDTLPQRTLVSSVRLGVDGAGLLSHSDLILDLTAEYALSKDRVYTEGDTIVLDPTTGDPVVNVDAGGNPTDTAHHVYNTYKEESGTSLLVNLSAGYQQKDLWKAVLGAHYLMSDTGWFNNLAQSPAFFPRRIMNTEKDADLAKYGVRAPLYSTFDALYHFTPKFTPSSTTLTNNEMKDGQTESYNIAPYAKNSYTTSVYTRKELEIINSLSDPHVQMALPNGLATANRTGFSVNPVVGYGKDNVAEIQGLFSQYSETQVPEGAKKQEFAEMGVGAKVDVFGLIGWSLPGVISGSYKNSETTLDNTKLSTQFINAGIYVRYFKRFGVTAGYQQATMELNTAFKVLADDPTHTILPIVKGTQNQWMVGLDYTLSKNAWLTINYGIVNVKNTYESQTALSGVLVDSLGVDNSPVIDPNTGSPYQVESTQKIVPVSNFTDYMNAWTKPGVKSVVHEFSLNLIEASINVDF